MAENDDIMDAVDASEKKTAPKASSKSESEPKAKPASKEKAESASTSKSDDDSFMAKVKNFIYTHPFIAMVAFYLVLSIFVKFWGWATIIFLAIPLVAAIRMYMLSKDVDTPIDGEDHIKLFWWARVGVYSSLAGLISIVALDWLNILHVFN